MPKRVRISDGTGNSVGLWDNAIECKPTTAYLMTYREDGCNANCAFCPQARESDSSSDRLSRVRWPEVDFDEFSSALQEADHGFRRVCIQSLNYQGVVDDLTDLVDNLGESTQIPISVSCQPLDEEDMVRLRDSGVERLGIPLDASTEEIFDQVKGGGTGGPYKWRRHLESLKLASDVFDGGVSTHLMVGLGETEMEISRRIQSLRDMDVKVALFAFTPVKGSLLENRSRPDLGGYRRVQIARHLIEGDLISFGDLEFNQGEIVDFGIPREDLIEELRDGKAFQTSGCPDCNRPFYNESPGGPLYNYPEKPSEKEVEKLLGELI